MQSMLCLGKLNLAETTLKALLSMIAEKTDKKLEITFAGYEKYIEHPELFEDILKMLKKENSIILFLNGYIPKSLVEKLNKHEVRSVVVSESRKGSLKITNGSVIVYDKTNYIESVVDYVLNMFTADTYNEQMVPFVKSFIKNFKVGDSILTNTYFAKKNGQPIIKLDNSLDNLGSKITLLANYKKLNEYYNWLFNKFKSFSDLEDFEKNFFTDSEIAQMYRSLGIRVNSLTKSLENIQCQVLERTDSRGNKLDTLIYIPNIKTSRSLNEVVIRMYYALFEGNVTVYSKGKYGIYTKFSDETRQKLDLLSKDELKKYLEDSTTELNIKHKNKLDTDGDLSQLL